jgi:glycosyltransferase involved in cell wall biosynthesis
VSGTRFGDSLSSVGVRGARKYGRCHSALRRVMSNAEPRRLVGGIVAFNDEPTIEPAIRSLLDQSLPTGWQWARIWVIASGCTDRTVAIVRRMTDEDPRVSLVDHPAREGKAAALAEILERAEGDLLVLLNGDARADPFAVAHLVKRASREMGPFAVMGRPFPERGPNRSFSRGLEFFWEVHHRVHEFYLGRGDGTHLSDELLLLPLAHRPPLARGIVNDGAFVAAWLRGIGGRPLYSPDALVRIDPPRGHIDHIRQRRRIRYGHRQIVQLTGIGSTTVGRLIRENPRAAWELLRVAYRCRKPGLAAALQIGFAEVLAAALAGWDRARPSRDYALWTRVSSAARSSARTSARVARTSRSRAHND